MSDAQVRAAIEQMEAWMADPAWEPDPEALSRWDGGFRSALARAEKGEGWPELAARAHALGRELDARADRLALARDEIKAELDAQQRGVRALKGYGAGLR
jgi:hypothetical protein